MLQQGWPKRIILEIVWHWLGVCRVAEPPEVEVAVLAHGWSLVSQSLLKCQSHTLSWPEVLFLQSPQVGSAFLHKNEAH